MNVQKNDGVIWMTICERCVADVGWFDGGGGATDAAKVVDYGSCVCRHG